MGSPTINSNDHRFLTRRQTSQPDSATSTSSPLASNSPTSKLSNTPPVGAVVGIVIGAIVISLIMAGCFAIFRRKKARKQDEEARAAPAKKMAETESATPKTPRTPRPKTTERTTSAPDGYHLKNRQSTGLLDDFFAMDVPEEKEPVPRTESSNDGKEAIHIETFSVEGNESSQTVESPKVAAAPEVPAPTTHSIATEKAQPTEVISSEKVAEVPKEEPTEITVK